MPAATPSPPANGNLHPFSGESPYRFKERLSGDEACETFLVEDLSLGREVVLVRAAKDLPDSAKREFLLKARHLGRLQHPGILPVYDMGMAGDTCFYTQRKPPARPLGELLRRRDPDLLRYFRSRGYRLQLLISIADTVAHAHAQGVFVGNLGLDSLVVGPHGEVIVHDWSASRSAEGRGGRPEQQVLDAWVRHDLKQLARLGMDLLHGGPSPADLTVQEWDRRSRDLPGDLQAVLDRAFLERPEPYASVQDFRRDVANHLNGYPLDEQKADVLLRLQGLYRRNRVAVNCLIVLSLAGLLLLMYNQRRLENKRDELLGWQARAGAALQENERRRRAGEAEAQRGRELDERLGKAREALAAARQETATQQRLADEAAREQAALAARRKEQAAAAAALEKEKAALAGGMASLDRKQEQEARTVSSLQERDREQARLLEAGDSTAQDEFLRALPGLGDESRKEYLEALKKGLGRGWVLSYLQEKAAGSAVALEPLPSRPRPQEVALSADGRYAAWTSEGRLFLASPAFKEGVVSLALRNKVSEPVFSQDRRQLYGLVGTNRLARVTLDESMRAVEDCALSSYYWKPKAWGAPLPYSPPGEVRSLGKNALHHHRFDDELPGEEPRSVRLELKNDVVDARASPRANCYAFKDARNMVHVMDLWHPERVRSLSRPDKESWGFLAPSGQLYFSCQGRVALHAPDGETQLRLLELRGQPAVLLEVPWTTMLWAGFPDKAELHAYDWARKASEPVVLRRALAADPLVAGGGNLLLSKADGEILLATNPQDGLPEDVRAELAAPSPLMGKAGSGPGRLGDGARLVFTGEDGKEAFLPTAGPVSDAWAPDPDSPAALVLVAARRVEAWDLAKGRRLLSIGVSGADLKRVRWCRRMNRPVTADDQGRIRVW